MMLSLTAYEKQMIRKQDASTAHVGADTLCSSALAASQDDAVPGDAGKHSTGAAQLSSDTLLGAADVVGHWLLHQDDVVPSGAETHIAMKKCHHSSRKASRDTQNLHARLQEYRYRATWCRCVARRRSKT
jgi:hypothetical protein